MPYLLCFPSSVAFSLPLNRVQQEMENACGRRIGYPADALADSFLSDLRVDLTAFSGFTPMSCHQETELPLVRLDKAGRERPDSRMNGFDSPAPITAISDRRPPVSVLMPARNAAAFVPAAIDSILEQTFADFELLIADDGSIDGTTEEIRRFTDPRIRCFRSGVPSGPAATRNELIDRARGEYLAMMDADDIAHPRRLEFQTSLMRRDPSIGVCGSLVRTFGSGRRFVQPYHLQHEEIFCDCLFESPVAQPACMLRSKVLGEHGIRYDASLRAAEDYDLFFRLLNVTRFENIPLILLDYRRHPAQTATVQSAALSSTRRIIHRCLIARLGIDATEAELDLHSAIADWKFPDDGRFPFNAHDWFIRLIEADRNAGVFEHTALRRLLADRFFAMTSFFAPRGNSLMSRLRALRLHREADAGARARAVQRVRGIFRAGIGQAAVI
jgi:glycosyltransferase involved in cell wall biosynthesis